MYEEQGQIKQTAEEAIDTICKAAIIAGAVLDEYGTELAESLEEAAEAMQKHYELDTSIMERYRAKAAASRDITIGEMDSVTEQEMEQAHDMIYITCDHLTDPKEIMRHVRTANEMMYMWQDGYCPKAV